MVFSRSNYASSKSTSTVSSTEAEEFATRARTNQERHSFQSRNTRLHVAAEFSECSDIKVGDQVTNIYTYYYSKDPNNPVFTLNDKNVTLKKKFRFLLSQRLCWALILLVIAFISMANLFVFSFVPMLRNDDFVYRHEMQLVQLSSNEFGLTVMPFGKMVVAQTDDGESCFTKEQCISRVQQLQTKSIEESYQDIPYNFLIGGDGRVYEGRGYRFRGQMPLGASASNFDEIGMIVAFIGSFDEEFPSSNQISGFTKFTSDSIRRGALTSNFTVLSQDQLVMKEKVPAGIIKTLEDMGETFYQVSDVQSRITTGLLPRGMTEKFEEPPNVLNLMVAYFGEITCVDETSCKTSVKKLQERDISAGNPDIRYSFMISSFGIYEGLGWDTKPKVSGKYLSWLTIGKLDEDLSNEGVEKFKSKFLKFLEDGKLLGKLVGKVGISCQKAIEEWCDILRR